MRLTKEIMKRGNARREALRIKKLEQLKLRLKQLLAKTQRMNEETGQ